MRYLSLDWFKSKIEKAVEIATEKVVTKKIEDLVEELSETSVEEYVKPYHSSIQVNNTLTVVLKSGQVLTKQDIESVELEKCRTEEDVIKLMSTKEVIKEKEKIEEVKKEIELIQSNFEILVETGDFEVKDNSVYLKGINRSMPKLLVNRFADVVNTQKYYTGFGNLFEDLRENVEYQSLIRFWKKCALNPSAQSSEDLYGFLEKHNMKIDQHGNFYAYRRVVSVNTKNKELVEFVSNAYTKVKAIWKKKTSSFEVYQENGEYKITSSGEKYQNNYIGNLEKLYLELPNMQEKSYTSSHTGLEDYRIGSVISMPRNEGDDDNNVSCSRGFHACNPNLYDYSSFGDTIVLMIISPCDVLSVPKGEAGKLRTCRWFFACTLDSTEEFILDEECFDVTHLGDVFEEKCLEDLEEHIKRGFTEEVKRHTFTIPNISANEISFICKSLTDIQEELKQRVVNI